MKKYSLYYYQTFKDKGVAWEGWVYKIYSDTGKEYVPVRESDEWFDCRADAELAAIDHISLLENGEG